MSKGKRLAGGVLLLALIALTFYLLLRNQPVSQLLDVLGRVKPGYVVLGLGLMFVFVSCEAMCSKLILGRLGHSLTYRRCLSFCFVGFYVSSITPSATGGQPAQIYYMSKSGVPAAHGALDMMMIAVCYQVTTLLYAAAAAIAMPGMLSAMGAGMGTSGLVGQFGAYSAMTAAGFSPAYTLFLILLMHVLLPAALSLGISELLRKIGWVRFGDQKLEL